MLDRLHRIGFRALWCCRAVLAVLLALPLGGCGKQATAAPHSASPAVSAAASSPASPSLVVSQSPSTHAQPAGMGQAPLKAAPTTAPSLLASQPGVTSSALPAPFLLHLPGIAGARAIDNHMTVGFSQGGFKGDVQIYDWTEQDGGLDALLANKRNHLEAKKIADLLTARFDKDLTAPIYLSCHSGGAGLAVWALEQLPDRVKIKSILMMSPALSPSYDLTAALRHVSGSLFVFSSLEDQLVLGLGCRTAGTIDGVHTDAAGRVGFKMPATGDATQYAKVVPMPYNPEWIRLGDRGDHIGAMNQRFARVVLAPLVLSGTIPPDTADKVAILAAQSLQATNRK